jgi:hypothetical protein
MTVDEVTASHFDSQRINSGPVSPSPVSSILILCIVQQFDFFREPLCKSKARRWTRFIPSMSVRVLVPNPVDGAQGGDVWKLPIVMRQVASCIAEDWISLFPERTGRLNEIASYLNLFAAHAERMMGIHGVKLFDLSTVMRG